MPQTPVPPLVQPVTRDGKFGYHLNLHPGQLKAWKSNKQIVAIIAGVRAGKSSFSAPWLHREMVTCGPGDYLAAAPSFPLLDKGLIPEITSFFGSLLRLGTPSARQFTISDEGHARLWPGQPIDRPRRIIYGHAANPESLAAMRVKAAVLDEAGQRGFRLPSFDEVRARVSLDKGRILICTTVYDIGWLKQKVFDPWEAAKRNHPDIDVINFDSTENPAFPREIWEQERRNLPLWKFDMKYRGRFSRPAGLIYDRFDPHRHVWPRCKIDDKWPRYAGLDFGATNTACVFLAAELGPDKLPTGRYVAYREYHPGKLPPETHAVDLLKGEPMVPMFAGGSRSEDDWRDRFRAAGLPVAEPPISAVEPQIDAVYELIANGRLIVMEDLHGLLDELASYSRVLDDEGEPTEEIDEDQAYHLCASLRYIVAWLTRGGLGQWRPTVSRDRDVTADTGDVFEKPKERDGPRITTGESPSWLDEKFPSW